MSSETESTHGGSLTKDFTVNGCFGVILFPFGPGQQIISREIYPYFVNHQLLSPLVGQCEAEVEIPTEKVGDFDTELVKEFMIALSSNSRMTLHFKMFHGENSHHIIEAMFKGLGRALGEAVSIDEKYRDEIPSTKGVL